jgi:hypothetical protein
MIFMQSGKDFVEDVDVFLVVVSVHLEIIHVHQYVADVAEYSFCESLEAGWAAEMAHG